MNFDRIVFVQTSNYDVCVVGSGPGGGIAAYALAKQGLKVALVEAGRHMRPGIDYNGHHSVYGELDKRLSQGKRGPVSGVWSDNFEREHFTGVGDRPGHGLLRAVGGRSLCWAAHSLRFGPLDFQHWPIGYDEVAPYYSRAEVLMGVHGFRDGLLNMPDGEFQKGVPMRCPELALKKGVDRLRAGGREMAFVAQRKAIPTESRPGGRAVCHYCGHCMKGCEVDSKYTSANTPIPLAMKTGNLTLLAESTMTRILHDRGRNRITGIEYVDRAGKTTGLKCRALVLSCSTVETARMLLINGLANSSGLVGRRLMSHFGVYVYGIFPGLKGRDISNDDGTDYFHSLLTGLYWQKPSKDFQGTYQVQCGAGFTPRSMRLPYIPGWGADLKKNLKEYSAMHVTMNLQGMMLPAEKTFVDLDPAAKDRFGLPKPRVHLHYTNNEVAMARDMVKVCEEVIEAGGGRTFVKPAEVSAQTLIIDLNHWAGTCRMGRAARDSVVNTDGQTHDIPNLFIADASVFAAYPEKNPTLTNVALSWRTADRLAAKAKKGEL
jgi:choline dehydrogenase-like flavoprotein